MALDLLNPTQTSVGQLCAQVLKEAGRVGIGQTALAEDITDTVARLQWMLQEWERKRWLVYHLVTLGVVSTGAQQYTVGPGGQINTAVVPAYSLDDLQIASGGTGYAPGDLITFSLSATDGQGGEVAVVQVETVGGSGEVEEISIATVGQYPAPLPVLFEQSTTTGVGTGATFNFPVWALAEGITRSSGGARPGKLEAAFLRQLQLGAPNQVDYPLRILQSMEDYSRIALKSLVSFPGAVFLDSQWPLATLYTYPVPQAGIYSINLVLREQLPSRFSSLDEVLNLPFEYYSAVLYNLALRCRPRYNITTYPGDMLPSLAKNSLNVVRGPNTQIAALTMPPELTRPAVYNIFSDQDY